MSVTGFFRGVKMKGVAYVGRIARAKKKQIAPVGMTESVMGTA
jgi:hypothetical protein